nr:hypothetical protein BN993_02076 [Virgibacillus halodenitrificans]
MCNSMILLIEIIYSEVVTFSFADNYNYKKGASH